MLTITHTLKTYHVQIVFQWFKAFFLLSQLFVAVSTSSAKIVSIWSYFTHFLAHVETSAASMSRRQSTYRK